MIIMRSHWSRRRIIIWRSNMNMPPRIRVLKFIISMRCRFMWRRKINITWRNPSKLEGSSTNWRFVGSLAVWVKTGVWLFVSWQVLHPKTEHSHSHGLTLENHTEEKSHVYGGYEHYGAGSEPSHHYKAIETEEGDGEGLSHHQFQDINVHHGIVEEAQEYWSWFRIMYYFRKLNSFF